MLALEAIASVVMWAPLPLGWMWVGGRVYDATGAVKRSLGFFGQPDTVFYDASGKAVEKVPTQLDAQTLQQGIRKILAS